MKDKRNKVVSQGITYLFVGAGTALFEVVLFQVLVWCSAHVVVANVCAVLASTAANFLLNGRVTFEGTSSQRRSLIRYLALFAFNTVFSTTVISIGEQLGAPAVIVKIATMCCTVCWNFVLYRRWVFV